MNLRDTKHFKQFKVRSLYYFSGRSPKAKCIYYRNSDTDHGMLGKVKYLHVLGHPLEIVYIC